MLCTVAAFEGNLGSCFGNKAEYLCIQTRPGAKLRMIIIIAIILSLFYLRNTLV